MRPSLVAGWLLFKEAPGGFVFAEGFLKFGRKLTRAVFKCINPGALRIATRVRFDSRGSHASFSCSRVAAFQRSSRRFCFCGRLSQIREKTHAGGFQMHKSRCASDSDARTLRFPRVACVLLL